MKITLHNYQEYVIDWIDGILPEETAAAFALFLDANPSIHEEIEDIINIDPCTLPDESNPPDLTFLRKTINDKSVSEVNFLEFVMARMDGELNGASQTALDRFLEDHPQHRREAMLFEATQMQPNPKVTFENKEVLRQPLLLLPFTPDQEIADEVIIAYLDDDLTPQQNEAFRNCLTNRPDIALRLKHFQTSRLTPDLTVKFPEKENLRRGRIIPLISRKQIIRVVSIAASLAVIAGIFLINRNPSIDTRVVAPEKSLTDLINKNPVYDDPTGTAVKTQVASTLTSKARIKSPVSVVTEPDIQVAQASVISLQRYPSRNVRSISPGAGIAGLQESIAIAIPLTAQPIQSSPFRQKLTIEEFPIEQIRYFTGGGNERPGLLAELSLPRLISLINPHERINSAGQQFFTHWTELKEKTLDELIPYR